MVQLKAKKDGQGNVIISEDSLEHLLNCLDNQKFMGESPPDAMDMELSEFQKIHQDNQIKIDDFNRQCREMLLGYV